jgi:type IV pilus assembly protein PilV
MGADMSNRLKQSNSGMVLLEGLISILLFSFGILGLVSVQVAATQNSVNSQDRAVASILANDMVSQMWIKNCSTVASISGDVDAWKLKVHGSILSNASGVVTTDVTTGLATITVTWKAPSKSSADQANQYVTSVFVNSICP